MATRTKIPPSAQTSFAASCIAVMLLANPKDLQAQQGEDEQQATQEIVVTGSRIARRDFSSPSPIATIDRSTLAAAPQPTLEESLNRMPQLTPDLERTANNGGNGTARANLRGLGSNRTLVLLNGRRLAPSGVETAVDINNLPQALIERVEIVTGGATTVYGSDAVAGVVNFITRTDLDGLGLDVTAYATEQGDSNIYDANLWLGHPFANGKGSITLYGAHYERRELFASERALTAVPINDAGGVLSEGGSLATPASVIRFPLVDFGNGPANTTFDSAGLPIEFDDPADRYNFASSSYLQVPLTRTSAGMFLNYEIGEQSEIYSEVGFTRNDAKQNLAPIPFSSMLLTNLDNPQLAPETQQFFANNFTAPFLPPGTAGFFLSRRFEDLGSRIFDRTNDYARIVAGLRGKLNFGWDFDVWFTHTENDEKTLLRNGASAANLQQGLFVNSASGECLDPSNGCVPIDIWGPGNISADALDFLRLADLTNTTSRKQTLVGGYLRGAPLQTWAGALDMAVGAEWRSDDGVFTADPALFSGDALGYRGSAGVDGKESVYEVYTEAVVPLLVDRAFAEYVALELGARYSNYDNAGSAWTYKVGGDWQMTQRLRFRVMFQHSVRAPSLGEAFQQEFVEAGVFVGTTPSQDPCSASADPVGNGAVDACVATGLPLDQIGVFEATVRVPTDFIRGGNPNLKPEEADSFTAGAVTTLGDSGSWQLSVDYFDIEVEDTIGDLVATVACFDPANSTNAFCDKFTRDPTNFNVIELDNTRINRGGQSTSGIDTQLAFSAELPPAAALFGEYASLSGNLSWTHVRRNSTKELSFGTTLHCAGKFGFPCNAATDGVSFPKNRITTNLSYSSGNADLSLHWRWISGTGNAEFLIPDFLGGAAPPDAVIREIGSSSYFDLGIGYNFNDHLYTRLNVSNLFDKQAPLMADAVVGNNTDTRLYDIFGRSFSLTLSLRY